MCQNVQHGHRQDLLVRAGLQLHDQTAAGQTAAAYVYLELCKLSLLCGEQMAF